MKDPIKKISCGENKFKYMFWVQQTFEIFRKQILDNH